MASQRLIPIPQGVRRNNRSSLASASGHVAGVRSDRLRNHAGELRSGDTDHGGVRCCCASRRAITGIGDSGVWTPGDRSGRWQRYRRGFHVLVDGCWSSRFQRGRFRGGGV